MDTPSLITIQPGNIPDVPYTPGGSYDPKLPLPYPFHVDVATGEIGRQEFWKGDPFSVVGFQKDAKVQTVNLFWDAAAADPDQIVGMFPVLIDTSQGEEGVIYTDTRPIISVHAND